MLDSPVTQGGVDDKRLHASDHHDPLPLHLVTCLGRLQPSAELLLSALDTARNMPYLMQIADVCVLIIAAL